MKRSSVWITVLLAFVVGVFAGIGLDSAASPKHRRLVFEVQPYQMANLRVHPGDTISLDIPRDGKGGAQLNWIGSNPCTNSDGSSCTINSGAPNGPYFFNCNSANYSCPDPGVQQGPAPPGIYPGYGKVVARDFAYLLGARGHHEHHPSPPPTTTTGPSPANTTITAIASCTNGVARLQDPNGNDLTTITAPVGETVYWIDPNGFSLKMTNPPAGLCQGGDPGTDNATQAECAIKTPNLNAPYTITPQGSPACSPLAAQLNTVGAAPHSSPGSNH